MEKEVKTVENKRMWEIKQQADKPDALQLYIYGDVKGNRRDQRGVFQAGTCKTYKRDAD